MSKQEEVRHKNVREQRQSEKDHQMLRNRTDRSKIKPDPRLRSYISKKKPKSIRKGK